MSLSGASRKGLWSGVGGGEESSGWGTGEVSRAGPDSEGTGMLWKEFVHYMNPSGLSVPFDLGSTGARVCACHGCCEAQWSRGCLSWPWGSSGPAPWSYPPGHRRLLCLQTETHSWPQPPWTQCWLASRGPGAPLALQVSAEGSCTAWSAWGHLLWAWPEPRGLVRPVGEPWPWQDTGDWARSLASGRQHPGGTRHKSPKCFCLLPA